MNTNLNIELTDSYKKSLYKNLLNDHITSVLDLAIDCSDNKEILSDKFKFTKQLYWECVDVIHEKNHEKSINLTDQTKDEYKKDKINLYKTIINKLGEFYHKNDEHLVDSIDFTVNNYFENLIYKDSLGDLNPWQYSNKILTDEKLLYTFTDDINEYKSLLRKNKNESSLTKELTIGVLCKGAREDYAQAYIKDNFAFRKLLLDLLDDKNHDCKDPIKNKDIIKLFRSLNVSESDLADNNIYNWILKPLKKFTKIGSNTDGYFIIRNEEDLYESYKSHYKNYIGYFKTLEKHRKYSEFLNYGDLEKYKNHLNEE